MATNEYIISKIELPNGDVCNISPTWGNIKSKPTISSPSPNGTSISFIDTITQTNGTISATKKTVPNATTSENGLMLSSDKEKLDEIDLIKQVKTVSIEPVQDLHGYESPWIGTDTDKQPYLFRKISDSSVQDKGTHEMDKLVGGTVAWNQLVQNGNFTDASGWHAYDTSKISFQVSNNVAEVTILQSGTMSFQWMFCQYSYAQKAIIGHKYLIYGEVYCSETAQMVITNNNNGESAIKAVPSNVWTSVSRINNALRTVMYMGVQPDTYVDAGMTYKVRNVMNIDLTQMFGSTIADYIYSLEQTTEGAGVAWFRNLFPASYYPYNAGELISVKTSAHVTRGFNQWDGTYEAGKWLASPDGTVATQAGYNLTDFIKVLPNTAYYKMKSNSGRNLFYDANKNVLPNQAWNTVSSGPQVFVTPQNAHYVRFTVTNAYLSAFCINISKTTGTPKNRDYVAYSAHTYPLDSDLELRGIPKLDSNNKLYYDGDVYEASGAVTRKYGIVDLGTLNWTKQTLSNNRDVFYTPYSSWTNLPTANLNRIINAINPILERQTYQNATSWGSNAFLFNVFSATIPMDRAFAMIFDSGKYTDAATFKTAMSGIMLIYELAEPTTETADPFTSTQVINPDGTEEYVDNRTVAIPVGHESNYANICPIEGWTGAIVTRTGKNLFDKNADISANNFYYDLNGDIINSANYLTTDYIKVKPGVTYYWAINGVPPNLFATHNAPRVACFDENKKWIASGPPLLGTGNPIDIPQNGRYVRLPVYLQGNVYETAMFVEGSTIPTVYEPYTGTTYPISWQSEAGTVYGGTLDVTTGVLTVTMASVDLGTLTWRVNSYQNDAFQAEQFPSKIVTTGMMANVICPAYKTIATCTVTSMSDKSVMMANNTSWLIVRDSAYTDATTFKAAMSGVQLVYELTAPQTYQLTPTQILLLAEHKHVWADCGDITLQSCFTNNAANVTGIVAIEHGGTGSATAGVNTVFAGPSSGATNAAPNFRSLVSADIPTISIVDKTSGTLPVTRGGTGAITAEGARANLGLGTMATETAANYLKLSGGTMTGGITLQGNQSSAWNDKGLLFTNGSRIGENSSGDLGIYAAGQLFLRPNCATAASGDGIEITTNGLYPTNDNSESLGSATKRWQNIYGSLIGNADTATTATNLSAKPSLATSGTTQITVTAGGKTSDAYTVPYATKAGTGSTVTITSHTNTTNGNKIYYLPFLTATSGDLSPHAHSSVYLYETVTNGAISNYDFCFGAFAIKGSITLWDGTNHYGNIRTTELSSHRTYDLPNASGTIALTTSNITGTAANVRDTVAVENGGTGATTAANARTNLGLGSMATATETNYVKVDGTRAMTNSLAITKAGECGIEVNNTQTTKPNQVAFIVGASGNGGIYSRKHSKWIVYSDANGNVILNGNASTASAFSANKSITLTGDVTGSASSTGGWSIATTIGAGKVTNNMLAGSIANGKLSNSKVTIAGTDVSLGGSITADTLRTSLGLSNAMHFLGVTTTNVSTGTPNTTATVTIGSSNVTAAAGDVVLYGSQEYVWGNSKWNLLGDESSYKVKQTAQSDPTASTTTSTTFIDTISQDANGVITATKKTLPTASNSVAGITKVGASGGAAAYEHTHTLSLTTDSGTSSISLAANTKYKLTAGGSTYVFTTPSDTNTWRGIQDNLTSSTNTTESLSAKQGYLLANGSARDDTKVSKSGDTMTGNLIAPSIRIANTYYGITFGRTTETPVETILHTGIKWVSGRHMPVIHITGYAYGLSSPVEFKIGFYIYGNQIGWCGVTNMGAWQPNVFLFKDNHDGYDYVGVGLAGSCYFLQLQADLQDEMGKFAGVETDSSKWSWTFSTTAGVIPTADGGTTCIQVPYKANILNPSKVNGYTVEANVPSNAKFTDTTALTSMTGTLTIDHGGTGATSAAGARTNLELGTFATKSSLAWNEITQSGANILSQGSSDVTASTEILTSYASNNGFSDNGGKGIVYRRAANKVVNATLVKAALGTVSATAKKFLKDTGSWVQVDWGDLTNKPSTFTPADHTQAVDKGGTNITSYTIGDILYASAATTLSKLAGNTTTTRKFLTSVATTSGTAVEPKWDTLTKSDVGLGNVENVSAVAKSGDTMTGSLLIEDTSLQKRIRLSPDSIKLQYYGQHSGSGQTMWLNKGNIYLDTVTENNYTKYKTRISAPDGAIMSSDGEIHIFSSLFYGGSSGGTSLADLYLNKDHIELCHSYVDNFDSAESRITMTNNQILLYIYGNTPVQIDNGDGTVSYEEQYVALTSVSINPNGVDIDGSLSLTNALAIHYGGTGATTAASARTNLDVPSTTGLGASGTWGISISGNAANVTGTVAIAHGGTGATTAATARQNLFGTNMADTAKFFITINDNWATGGYITNAKAAEIIKNNASGTWNINVTGTAANVTGTVAVEHGGTSATTAREARASLGCNDIGHISAQSAITPVPDNQQRSISITKDCWVCVSFHVVANTNGVAILSRNDIPVINNANTNEACNYWANAQFPCKAGGSLKYRLSSNASDSYISFLTVD